MRCDRNGQSFWNFANLDPREFPTALNVDDRNVVGIGVAYAQKRTIGCKRKPVWTSSGSHFSHDLLRLHIVDVDAIIEQARYPEFAPIGSQRKSMSAGIRGFVFHRVGGGVCGG